MNRPDTPGFAPISRAYNRVFKPGRLSLGLVAPLEAYMIEEMPTLERHIERVKLAEELGFSAIWLRDIPFSVPSFGDVGQIYDPFVYLGALAACTERIGLGVASVILPLRHPAHVAKAAASADLLSGGRVLLGVASGDRPEEYPALNMDYDERGARFRDSVNYMRAAFETNPRFEGLHGRLNGYMDMLPKPVAGRIPMLITGGCQQTPEWVAEQGDGWMTYPRNPDVQGSMVAEYRQRVLDGGGTDKPVMQSLYVDVLAKPDAPARPIHLGFSAGTGFLLQYLREVESLGVNHVALNLRFNNADIETTLKRIAEELLPEFSQ
ncbi:LLM class oxidoreductase [Denitrobaculum tricleocarpae]|uniref:LLM class oxidoreductase n=1 Tax=Denitrobaculum tricleocarpae TaxID=2591009 RepID=A0A545TY79_9PROT|nr:LLM class oxidoreductase [Denitrobaculum tricleocarpae]TQV82178.1 LLM class oxidoreductase [Denitrobaculum tricleocarpae]